jgi:hypothetical protein
LYHSEGLWSHEYCDSDHHNSDWMGGPWSADPSYADVAPSPAQQWHSWHHSGLRLPPQPGWGRLPGWGALTPSRLGWPPTSSVSNQFSSAPFTAPPSMTFRLAGGSNFWRLQQWHEQLYTGFIRQGTQSHKLLSACGCLFLLYFTEIKQPRKIIFQRKEWHCLNHMVQVSARIALAMKLGRSADSSSKTDL